MPAAIGSHWGEVSLYDESGTTLNDEQYLASNSNNHNDQLQLCTRHLSSPLGLDCSKSLISTICPSDGYQSPDIRSLSCYERFLSGFGQTIKTTPGELRRCTPEAASISLVAASTASGQQPPHIELVNAHCSNDLFQRLTPSELPERLPSSVTECTRAGHRSASNFMSGKSKVSLAFSIYVVLALLNGCASASKDFYFPDIHQGESFHSFICLCYLTRSLLNWERSVNNQ